MIATSTSLIQSDYPEALVCVYLYGSRARGAAGPLSDVDLAVLYAVDPPAMLEGFGLDLAADLERRLGRPVDLVVLNQWMIGFRNIVVHGYQHLNPILPQDLVVHHLDNLLAFTSAIRSPLLDSKYARIP